MSVLLFDTQTKKLDNTDKHFLWAVCLIIFWLKLKNNNFWRVQVQAPKRERRDGTYNSANMVYF